VKLNLVVKLYITSHWLLLENYLCSLVDFITFTKFSILFLSFCMDIVIQLFIFLIFCLIFFFPITGDQGFLNSYYEEFPNAHVFQPGLPEEVRKSRPVPDMERLSTLYNADVGLYMLANKVLCEQRIRWFLFMLIVQIDCLYNCWCCFLLLFL